MLSIWQRVCARSLSITLKRCDVRSRSLVNSVTTSLTLLPGRSGVVKLSREIGGFLLSTAQWNRLKLKNTSLFRFTLSLLLVLSSSLLLLSSAGASWVGVDLATPSLVVFWLAIPLRVYLLASKFNQSLDNLATLLGSK